MPWRAEPLYEIAKWHDSQISNCSRVAACETQHHLMAYLHGKEVQGGAFSCVSCAGICSRVPVSTVEGCLTAHLQRPPSASAVLDLCRSMLATIARS